MFTQPHPLVMGILNVTPDSFSDGGLFVEHDKAAKHALAMQKQGADIVDIGGESTRPGAADVSVNEQLDRVIPVIHAIREQSDIPISIDTSSPDVMREAITAGANIINDIRALTEPGAMEAAVELSVPVCLMHMQGQPRTMQQSPQYDDVVDDVKTFLQQRAEATISAGLPADNICIDPGFGFGKTLQHNYELLRRLEELTSLGFPVLVGTSRKSMIGNLLDIPADERISGSIATAVMAMIKGARILRVHDVEQTCHAREIYLATYMPQYSLLAGVA